MASGIIALTRTGSGYLTGQIVWSSVSNGTQANTSAVTVQLQLQRSALNTTTGTFNGTLTIGGESENISWFGSLPSMTWVTVKTKTVTIRHNADGNGSCYLYAMVHGPTGTTMEGTNVSGSATVTLDTIPRYASIISAADFTDEGNPAFTYSNPAGGAVNVLQACISLDGATAFIPYTDIPKTGTSYTFSLTEQMRDALRAAAANSKTLPVYMIIRSTIGSSTSYGSKTAVMSIVNAAPTVSPTVVDTNSATIALTGDRSILIALHSSADVTFHAAAKKYATVVSTRAENGSNVLTADGKISQVQNAPFVFTVSDSRGNITTQNAANRIIPYLNPTCNIGKNMPEGDGTFVLTVTGRFYNGSFGATTNGLTVQYRYKAAGGSYPDAWTTFPEATKNGNEYTAQAYLTGLDYQSAYTFQARVIDAIHTDGVYSAESAVIAEPVFDWGKDDFRFRVPVQLASVYRSEHYCAVSNEQIIAAMRDAYERTADQSWGFFTLQVEISGLQLRDGMWHMAVFRTNAECGVIGFVSYGADRADVRFSNYIGGTYGEITQIFAPAGYGLGTNAAPATDISADDLVKTGFYFAGQGLPDGWGNSFIYHMGYDDGSYATQIAYSLKNVSWWGGICVKREKTGGLWQPWEWVNPPMAAGVEYRTTERYLGKPVYTQLIPFGELADNATVDVPVNIADLDRMWTLTAEWAGSTLPINTADDNQVWIQWRTDKIVIRCVGGWGGGAGYATLKYTKTTD